MMDDVEVLFNASKDTGSYLESLAKTRELLKDSPLLFKLDQVIEAEIELALLEVEKAKGDFLKNSVKDNVRPIK